MEIKVEREKCCGFGECIALAPDVFAMGADNRVVVIGEVTAENQESTQAAVWACPAEAIELTS
ncbi:ferredoxin [Streptomyces sp. NBC_01239]|uniref:ferredoxin n=1 Tax=Streptomyces sp. NBC_01239 TaxID=2903792 RepID=UPI00224FBC3F|nr:ferredoxin [Streptomyces sp. NBC_01239]MCX4817979.1 ferredoxin [Streptomyces sp. NBC_01239]